MKNSEVQTQLAEAAELLNMLEHLTTAYNKEQSSASKSAPSVAWQGLRFNLLECRKRVLAAKRMLGEQASAPSQKEVSATVENGSRDIDRSTTLPSADAGEQEESFPSLRESSPGATSGERLRELSPLARRIRRAPTSSAFSSEAGQEVPSSRARTREREVVSQMSEGSGSLRELRALSAGPADGGPEGARGNGAPASQLAE